MWAVFAGSVFAIPVFATVGNVKVAWGLIGFVFLEVIVLAGNRMRCPLTDVAGRYTSERQDNFDIYLPLWLARHKRNKCGRFPGSVGIENDGVWCALWGDTDIGTG